MTRGSSLSDQRVRERINKSLIPVEINLSDVGFPTSVPGLKPWQNAYENDWRYKFGFATSVVLSPDGKWPLGTSGSGHIWEYKTSINYNPDKYLQFVDECLDRFARAVALGSQTALDAKTREAKLAALQAEILRSIEDANHHAQKPRGWDAEAAKLAQ
jgi:hypothetical protein